MSNLDDLRFFLALARHDNLVKAAESLGVSRMTVSRHIAALEKQVGARLFDKTSRGWVLTQEAAALLPEAERVETSAKAIFGRGEAPAESISGTVRIVTTDGFGHGLLAPWTADIRNALPDVRLEIVTSSRVSPFTSRSFDLAITVHRPNLTGVQVRRLTAYRLGLYASSGYLERRGVPESVDDLVDHNFVWFVESLHDLPELQMLRPIVPDADVVAAFSTVNGQQAAAAAGVGIGLLPRFSADEDPRLVRILSPAVEVTRAFHLVARDNSVGQPHVRAVIDILLQHVARAQPLFTGSPPGS